MIGTWFMIGLQTHLIKICCTCLFSDIKKSLKNQLRNLKILVWKSMKDRKCVETPSVAWDTLIHIHSLGLKADWESSLWHTDDCWHAWTLNASEQLHSSPTEISLLYLCGSAVPAFPKLQDHISADRSNLCSHCNSLLLSLHSVTFNVVGLNFLTKLAA